jgi:hypothetical protein
MMKNGYMRTAEAWWIVEILLGLAIGLKADIHGLEVSIPPDTMDRLPAYTLDPGGD